MSNAACIHNIGGLHFLKGSSTPCAKIESNFQDWWLDQTRPQDRAGWKPVDVLVKEQDKDADHEWTPELQKMRAYMEEPEHRGEGGLVGIDLDAYHRVRRGLIALGGPVPAA